MGKRRGSPQIPLALRKQLADGDEFIEKRFVSPSPGNTTSLSRKVLRKRQRSEKKMRRQAFHTNTSADDIKKKQEQSLKPPKKRQKKETKPVKKKSKSDIQTPKDPAPLRFREDEEIEYFEKKLKNYYHKADHLDDIMDGITAGTGDSFDLNQHNASDSDQEQDQMSESDEEQEQNPISSPEKERTTSTVDHNEKPTTIQKYIPPSLRKKMAEASDPTNSLSFVKKLRGALNRVSEGNVVLVGNEIQLFFESHSRNEVNKQLAACILEDCGEDSVQNTLLPVYAGLISYLHFIVGTDVGGSFLNYWYNARMKYEEKNQKEAYLNCIKLLGFLYNYEMLHCTLIFDVVRNCISRFEERDIESLLAILRITGLELRADDPTALKDIIVALQERVRQYEEESRQNISDEFGIRIKFMLDMIYELKNNKKNHFISSKAPPNLLLVSKKARTNSLSEQLQISMKELSLSTDKKWWIRGTSMLSNTNSTSGKHIEEQNKILAIAKKQGMSTDTRRSIFATMMQADDYLDAFENLLKLNLKGKDDREIVNVLIHCCTKEQSYNPFYGYLGVKLCSFDYNHKFTFQYNFWDKFKRLEEENIAVVKNLAMLLSHMLGKQALSLSIFKVVEFYQLKPKEIVFYRLAFSRLFCDNNLDGILQMFERMANNIKFSALREQLSSFFASAFRKSSLRNRDIYTEEEASKLQECLREIKMLFRQAPASGFD